LLAGRGLVTDALWSFGTAPLVVPREAFEVWLPLPTLVAAVPMALFGATFAAAQVSSVLIGALVPVLAWRLGADVAVEQRLPPGRARTLAVGTGLTAAVSLPLLLHSTLPDSTMLFGGLTLATALLITRIRTRISAAGRPRPMALLAGLGVVLGLAALTRNEALWLAATWAVLAWRTPVPTRDRLALIAIPGLVALAVFAPWMVRDSLAFGSPLPGQALTNALSVQGTDIFAWTEPVSIGRYLAVGPARLLEMRAAGIEHNLFDVLLVPGAPLSIIGLVGLPWAARIRALRPLLLVSLVIFLVTSLLFPISTTWGTFLHAAGAIHVVLIISALLGLDRLIAAIGRRRSWTRPVAWLAPALTVSGALLFSVALLPAFGNGSAGTERQLRDLSARIDVAGFSSAEGPLITDAPIWLPYVRGGTALAVPYESPSSVLDLARRFHAPGVVLLNGSAHPFSTALRTTADPAAGCFDDVTPPATAQLRGDDADAVRIYRIVCP
ncbi:MAG: hypothetical protein QOF49_988, partial [Chloroflexota bacterium]|nr:hypothetical protein [Chloroflexota bacterium]